MIDTLYLLDAAQQGNDEAFSQLTEPHRHELLVHCYRMLGAAQDAEDAVQMTLLRSWQNLHRYERRLDGSWRAWLYKIATNVCLDLLRRQRRRSLVQADIAAETEAAPQHVPLDERLWLQPIPQDWLSDLRDDPEAIYTVGESVALAFIAVLQQLTPRQRAVLLLRDVLGMKAGEVAGLLETTPSAVNSSLLRARKVLDENQTVTKLRQRPLPDAEQNLLDRYVQAWQAADVDRLVSLLREDGIVTMPPLPSWYQGRAAIRRFLAEFVFEKSSAERWHVTVTRANGQPALALYFRPDEQESYRLFCLHVLTLECDQVARIDLFMTSGAPYLTADVEASWLPYFNLPESL